MRYGCIAMSLFCAWVMWKQEQSFSNGRMTESWEIVGAEEVHEKCNQGASGAATNLAGNLKGKGKLISDTAVAIDADNIILTYKCLPDTVDPRAPKEGK